MRSDREFLNGIYAKADKLQSENKSKAAKNFTFSYKKIAAAALSCAVMLLIVMTPAISDLIPYSSPDPHTPSPISLEDPPSRMRSGFSLPFSSGENFSVILGTVERVDENSAELRIGEIIIGNINDKSKAIISREANGDALDMIFSKKESVVVFLCEENGRLYLKNGIVDKLSSAEKETYLAYDGTSVHLSDIREFYR